jgi:hypothetical protein
LAEDEDSDSRAGARVPEMVHDRSSS